MIKVRIRGIKDGKYPIAEEMPSSLVEDMPEEFCGNVVFEGNMRKLGKRYTVEGQAHCQAKLLCDLSLEEFYEDITADIAVSFMADTVLFNLHKEGNEDEKAERVVHEDDESFDLTDDIREQLIVNMPMKRIAPQYRGKTFEELHPELSSEANDEAEAEAPTDERWGALKNLKLN